MRTCHRVSGFAFLFCLLALGSAGADEAEERVEPELQAKIDAAIERGVVWLRGRQRNTGAYPAFGDNLPANTYNPLDPGVNALVVQTLAHCGVAKTDPAIQKCLTVVRADYAKNKGQDTVYTYTAATIILALLAAHVGEEAAVEIKRDRYGNPIPPKRRKPCKLPPGDRRLIQELVKFLVRAQVKPAGGWRYPGNPVDSVEADTDLSNTQYALLALDAAARCRIEAPVETWKLAAEHLLREQEEEGIEVPVWIENEDWEEGQDEAARFKEAGQTQARGWCYLPGHNALATGSMTCAGVTCLAIVKEWLWARKALEPELRRRLDKGMLDGLAWLGDHFTVEDNPDPPENMWHYYYLYGLERTGAKTGVKYLARHDWYREGAVHLLAAQEENGGWKSAAALGKPADNTESEITQTCFALLFLKRATRKPVIPVTPPVITGGGGAPVDNR